MYMKKLTVLVVIIVSLLVLAGGIFAVRKYAADRAAKKEPAVLAAADKAEAKNIYRQTGRKPVGMINGEPFFDEDLAVYAAELRAAVSAYYGRKYNLGGMGAKFWDTEYDGATPREFLNNLALEDMTRNIVLIQEARARGIDTPDTYSALEEERAQWNAPTDDIQYGPKTLGPAEYNSYRITGITDALKTILLQNELAPTMAQLKASFDSLDESQKMDDFEASGVRFSWDEGLSDDEIRAEIKNSLKRGIPPEEITDTMSTVYPGFSREDFEVNSRYVSRGNQYDQARAELLREAAEGTVFPGPMGRPELYYVTTKKGGGILSFEQAPLLGRNKWINDRFEVFMDEKVKAARITLLSGKDFE